MSSFIQFKFLENDYLSAEEGGVKSQKNFLGRCRRSFLVRVFLLEACDWLKCREDFQRMT